MDPNEPPFIQYEEIPLPDEEDNDDETLSSETVGSSSSEEDEDDVESLMLAVEEEEVNEVEEIRKQTISRLLDNVLAPRKVIKDGKNFLVRLSRRMATREEIVDLSRTFEEHLKERQARMQGFCPIRRELYNYLFDEVIRQATISCAERGSLLLRVRDEFRMTMMAYESLYDSGVEYGSRKAMEAELGCKKVEAQYKQLQEDVARAKNRIRELEREMEADTMESKQRMDLRKVQHEQKMEFLSKLNRQLKEQLAMIS